VMDAFGIEAPAVLNNYALNLEGMLDSAVAWGNQAANTIQGYAQFSVNEHQENLAYNEILTNPDVLSDYTLKFFGPEGPYPVYENEQQLETPVTALNQSLTNRVNSLLLLLLLLRNSLRTSGVASRT
jgi:hypothetical protein